MELNSSQGSINPNSQPIRIKFGDIVKGKGIAKITDDSDRSVTDLKVKNVRQLHGADANKKMKIHGNVVRFNVMNTEGKVFRVGVKIKDFAANESHLNAYLKQSFNTTLPTAIPKQLQKQIDKMHRKQTGTSQKVGFQETKNLEKKEPELKRMSELKDFPGVTEEELQDIRQFYKEAKPTLDELEEPMFYNRNLHYPQVSVILPRSIVHIPEGECKGTYVLIKEHGGQKHFGLGSFNRVTLAVNIETGEQMAWRSARREGVKPNEIAANEAACKFPDHFDAADNFVEYIGNVRENKEGRLHKTGLKSLDVNKIGSIVKISKGGDLKNYLTNNNPPLVKRLQIFSEFQEDLHLLHTDLKKTHRDLKPDNITMTEDGHPRVADFGYTVDNNSMQNLSGSPLWIPPEVYRNDSFKNQSTINPSMDMWSSGVMLLQIMGDNNAWHDNFRDHLNNDLRKGVINPSKMTQVKKTVYGVVRENLRNEGCNEKEIDEIIAIADRCLTVDPKHRSNAKNVGKDIAKIAMSLSNKVENNTI